MLQENDIRNQLVHRKESIYFGFTVVLCILAYLSLLVSIIGIVIVVVLMIFSYFIHALSMASIRRNGVRISEQQFPDMYEKAVMLAEKMELGRMPSIYVLESSGFLNAFATRFFGKNMVVVYSEIFDLSEEGREDELLYILAHEFAHIKRRHVLVHLLLLPAMYVPFLGEAYMRACEYTCDRYAAYYVGNFEAAKEALVMLAIGKKLSSKVNQEAFVNQIREESGFFAWLNEKLATHPDLPKRINALDHWIQPEQYPLVREKKRGVVFGTIIISVVSIGLIASAAVAVVEVVKNSDMLPAFLAEDPSLIQPAKDNDVEKLEQLLTDGADIEAKDIDGYTALQHAVMWGNIEAAELLLENGADVNTTDSWGLTPLMNANYDAGGIEMAQLLLDYGADSSLEDFEGYTAYDHALDYDNNKLLDLLKKQSSDL